jgi:hypothetical protein
MEDCSVKRSRGKQYAVIAGYLAKENHNNKKTKQKAIQQNQNWPNKKLKKKQKQKTQTSLLSPAEILTKLNQWTQASLES